MKKLLFILIGLMLFTFISCNKNIEGDAKTSNKSAIGDAKIAEEYVKSQGYEITAYKGEVKKYVLEKSKFYGSTGSIPYQQAWGVQKIEPDKYFGKEITIYGFTVKNHHLETIYEESNGANVYIMLSEGKVIGGYSHPNVDIDGAYYSIDGKTLEEVTGLSFQQWSEDWKKKYGN
jgi:hypothetical protein